MNKSTKNAANLQQELSYPVPLPEKEIRQRISDLVIAGGIHTITEKGSQNIAKMMRISEQEASRMIRQETEKLAGRGCSMNASDTQRESYAIFQNSGRTAIEKKIVLKALAQLDKPVTRRQLSKITGLPQNHLTRVLYNLQHVDPPAKPLVEIAYKAKCPETNVRVQWYQLISK